MGMFSCSSHTEDLRAVLGKAQGAGPVLKSYRDGTELGEVPGIMVGGTQDHGGRHWPQGWCKADCGRQQQKWVGKKGCLWPLS